MDKATAETLKISLRQTISAYSHLISRVKKNDHKTMRGHLIMMMSKVEHELNNHFGDITQVKAKGGIRLIISYLLRRPTKFCEDSYINQACFIIQYHNLQLKLVEKKFASKDRDKFLFEREKLVKETARNLLKLTG